MYNNLQLFKAGIIMVRGNSLSKRGYYKNNNRRKIHIYEC